MRLVYVTRLLIVALVLASTSAALGQSDPRIDDWASLSGFAGSEVAVKPESGKTSFGILRSADDSSLELVQEDGQEKTFIKAQVEKVWLARLKGSRNTGKGAAIGGAVGGGIGVATLLGSRNDGQAAVAVPVYAILGAGIGAVGGFFSRKKNQKLKLIYKR